MAKHFWWGFMYWAKTGKRSYGYIMNGKDYHHALERYKREQILKTERSEMDHLQ